MGFPECAPYRKNATDISERDRLFKDPKEFLEGVLRNDEYSHIVMPNYFVNVTSPVIEKYNYKRIKEFYHSFIEETPLGPAYDVRYLIYRKSSS